MLLIQLWQPLIRIPINNIFLSPATSSNAEASRWPQSDVRGFWNFPLHCFIFESITLKAFTMTIVDGTKCKTCFGCPRMVLYAFFRDGVTLTVSLRGVGLQSYSHKQQGGGQSLTSIRCQRFLELSLTLLYFWKHYIKSFHNDNCGWDEV